MTIPSKGSRKITVAGKEYAWHVRKSPTYCQEAFEFPMSVAIESRAEDEPCILMVDVGLSRPDNWINPHQTAIKPSMIRDMIETALREGWLPANQKSPFLLRYPVIRGKA